MNDLYPPRIPNSIEIPDVTGHEIELLRKTIELIENDRFFRGPFLGRGLSEIEAHLLDGRGISPRSLVHHMELPIPKEIPQ